MKIYKFVFFVVVSLYCCGGKQKETQDSSPPNPSEVKKVENSIPYLDSDTIFKKGLNSYLKIQKAEDDFLKLDYKLGVEEKEHSFKLRYFNNSDVVFPEKGIGFLDSKNINLERCYIYNDSILILPILGVNNSLSIYVVDLKNENVLADDIRTSLSFLWIKKKKKLEFVMSDTPEISDSTYKYVLRKYELNKDKLKEIKLDSILLKYDLKSNLKREYKYIRKF
jgi:hypothetical protein